MKKVTQMKKRALFSGFVLGLLLVLYGCKGSCSDPGGIPAFPRPPSQASAWAEINPALLRNPSDEVTLLTGRRSKVKRVLLLTGRVVYLGESAIFGLFFTEPGRILPAIARRSCTPRTRGIGLCPLHSNYPLLSFSARRTSL